MPPTPNPNRTASKAARGSAVFLVLLLGTLGTRLVVDTPIRPPFRRTNPPRRPARYGRGAVRRFAVPHVFAGSERDAWRAVGYLQGRDRLWQMELYRRAASGRLSELLGEATVAIDQRFLTLGLRAGRRARVGAHAARRPNSVRELRGRRERGDVGVARPGCRSSISCLRLTPEPWTPIDSLAISKLFAWRLGENHRAELLRYALVEELGPRALELFPHSPEWAPVIILDAQLTRGRGAEEQEGRDLDISARVSSGCRRTRTRMSNSWVIHGSRTASGRPILANDPHLADRDAVGVVGSARRLGHVERCRRHHPRHSLRRHRPQREDRLGTDERRIRRAGLFRRAARSVAAALSSRR